ncbi:MAG: hypothetical protein ACW99F_19805 [Candidatus Hodarchaeales archaeon]
MVKISEELAFRELEYHYDLICTFDRSESDNILTELIYSSKFPDNGSLWDLFFTNSNATIFEIKRNYDYLIDTIWLGGYWSTKQQLWLDNELILIIERPGATTSCTQRIDFGRLLVPKGSYLTLSIISAGDGAAFMYAYGASVYGKKLVKDPLYLKKELWEDMLVENIHLEIPCPQAELVTYYMFPYDFILDHINLVFLYQHFKYPNLGPHFVAVYCTDIYIDDVHMSRLNGYRSMRFDPGDLLIKKGSVLKMRSWHGMAASEEPTNIIDIYGRKLL